MENLTQSEKAALYFQILERCDDWKIIYRIAIGPDRFDKMQESSQRVNASKWKTSERIQTAHQEIKRNFQAAKEDIEKKAVKRYRGQETETTEADNYLKNSDEINFLDSDEFLKHANQVANSCKDEKERRAWLEMIAKYMGYKDQNDSENTEIKRYYIMKTCETCEIYNKCRSCPVDVCPK
jgi:hypothetical protein